MLRGGLNMIKWILDFIRGVHHESDNQDDVVDSILGGNHDSRD
jgi:hypothetical protein